MALADVANLVVQLRLDDSGFTGKLRGVQGQLNRMQGGFSQVSRGVGQVGSGLARLGTVAGTAAVGGLTAVVTASAQFEQAFAGIRKTVDELDLTRAGTSFEELRQSILKMSTEIPISANELARLGEAAGALGVRAEDIDDFIRVTALLGETTDVSADMAATALGKLGNQLDLRGQDYERFGDILVNLGNKGASTEAEILAFAERIAAAGNQADFSTEDVLGFASAMASLGLEAEAGSTAFSRLLNDLTLSIATGGKEVKAFADTTGTSIGQFTKLFKEDASSAVQLFLKNLGQLDRFEAARILEQAGITGARQIDAVFRLAQGYDVLAGSLDTAAEKTAGLTIEAEKKFDTTIGNLGKLRGALTSSAILIGDQLIPIITDLSKEFAGFLGQAGTQNNIRKFALDLAAGVRSLVTELRGTDFSGLIGGMKIAAEVAKGAFDAFRSLPGPIQQLAIAALVANKVSGGGVGLIAKGFSNLIGGAIKIAFPKFDIFTRGSSPANPLFVSAIGGLGGVGGGVLGGGGKPSFLGNLLRVTIVGAVAVEGFNIAADLAGINAPQHAGPGGRPFRATNIPAEELRNLVASVDNLRERAEAGDAFAARQLVAVEKRIAELKAITGHITPAVEDARNEFRLGRQQLSARMDRVSSRVNEARQAVNTGFTRFNSQEAARASRLQSALAVASRSIREGTQAQRQVAAKVAEARSAIGTGFSRSNDQLGVIARKETSFTANVTNNVTATLSTYQSIQTLVRVNRIRVGTGFTPNLING